METKKKLLHSFCAVLVLAAGLLIGAGLQSHPAYAQKLEVNTTNFPDSSLRELLLKNATEEAVYDDAGNPTGSSVYTIDTDEITYLTFGTLSSIPDLSKLTALDFVTIGTFRGKTADFGNSSVAQLTLRYTTAASLKLTGSHLSTVFFSGHSTKTLSLDTPNLGYISIVGNKKLKSISGLSKAKNLTNLSIDRTQLTGLDASVYKKLTTLDLYRNPKLKTLKVPSGLQNLFLENCKKLNAKGLPFKKMTKLEYLDISNTKLSSINLSKCKKLIYLDLSNNSLKSVNVSKNTKLDTLNVNGNKKIKKVNLAKNKALTHLNVGSTSITKLNLSKNKKISSLDVSNSKLTSLSLKPLKNLHYISFYGSRIKKLNLTKYYSLTIFYELKKGQSVSLKKYLGKGYTATYTPSGLTFNSKKTTVKVSKKAKKKSWYTLTLQKGKKTYSIDVYVKK